MRLGHLIGMWVDTIFSREGVGNFRPQKKQKHLKGGSSCCKVQKITKPCLGMLMLTGSVSNILTGDSVEEMANMLFSG
jgi:hypothetical protein